MNKTYPISVSQPRGSASIPKHLLLQAVSRRSLLESNSSPVAGDDNNKYFKHFKKLSLGSNIGRKRTSTMFSKDSSVAESKSSITNTKEKPFGCNFLMDDPKLFNIFGENEFQSASSFVLVEKRKRTKLKMTMQKKRLVELSRGKLNLFSLHSNPDKSHPQEFVSKTKDTISLSSITNIKLSKRSSSVIQIKCYPDKLEHLHQPTLYNFDLRFDVPSLAKKWLLLILEEIYSVSLIIENMASFFRQNDLLNLNQGNGLPMGMLSRKDDWNQHLPCLYKKRLNLYLILAENLHPNLDIDEFSLNRKLYNAKKMYKEIVK